jgi:23S rRNA (adenine2030-N6)-methyltransferase
VNYRHAFHAGNHADILKHTVLLLILGRLAAKPSPFAVLDTHAGAGRYDLAGPEAARSPEWRGGAERIFDWREPPAALAPLSEAIAALNPGGRLQCYPGSPWLVRHNLRARDRLIACELEPRAAAALRSNFAADPRVQTHRRDGYEAMRALLPFPERRGVVLIDPPFEREDEMAQSVGAIRTGLQRFRHGIYLWWRPLKDPPALEAADGELLAEAGVEALRVDLAVDTVRPEGKLAASSLLVLNPPHLLQEDLEALLPALRDRLALGPGAFFSVRKRGA